MSKTTLSLSYEEIFSLYTFLIVVMAKSQEISRTSLYYKMQLQVLGEILEKKIHPKILIRKEKKSSVELKDYQALALQVGIMEGWANFMDNPYQQNAIRMLSIEQLPRVIIDSPAQLMPPDVWD